MIAELPATEAPIVPFPRAPRTLEEAGLPFDLAVQLILKTLHFSGELTGAALAAKLGLQYPRPPARGPRAAGRPAQALPPLDGRPGAAARRDLQAGRARRAHGDPPVRRLRRHDRALRVPGPDRGPGLHDHRPGPRPRRRDARTRSTRSRSRRRVIAAKKRELARTRSQLEAREAELPPRAPEQGSRRVEPIDQNIERLEGDIEGLEDKIQAQLQAAAEEQAASGAVPGSLPAGPSRAAPSGFIWPVNGSVVSPFGMRWGRMHEGVDIASPSGTPIRAVKAGAIALAAPTGGYGNYTCVEPRRRALQLLRPPVLVRDHLGERRPGRHHRLRRLHRPLLRRPPALRGPDQRLGRGSDGLPLDGVVLKHQAPPADGD